MNKLAIVHLYCHGYTDEDLIDFSLKLSNPSTIAQQQKLELFKSRFEAASSALGTAGLVNREWVQKNILRLSDEEIKMVRKGLIKDKLTDIEIEQAQLSPPEGPEGPAAGQIPLDLSAPPVNIPGIGGPPEAPSAPEAPDTSGPSLDLANLSEKSLLSLEDEYAPIKVQKKIKMLEEELEKKDEKQKEKTKKERKNHLFADDHFSKYQRNRKREKDPLYDVKHELKSDIKYRKEDFLPDVSEDFNISEYLDNKIVQNAKMTADIKSTLSKINPSLIKKRNIILEGNDNDKN